MSTTNKIITLDNIHITDFSQLNIDEQWNYAPVPEHKMHRIHTYPAKFPAFITKKAIELAENENFTVDTVADIFCGCGTTAYEATRNGKNFWGCDINPVATLIATVKNETYSQTTLDEYFSKIIHLIETTPQETTPQETTPLTNINPRISYWFHDSQITDLLKLKSSIYEVTPESSKYRSFFLCAFSNILKSTSKWLQKSIKPTIDPNKKIIAVTKAFRKQFNMMKAANTDNTLPNGVKTEIKLQNFINSKSNKKFDLLVTSPPYVTSYEYADLHQLSILWLDFAQDFRDFRVGCVGTSFHDSDFEQNKNQLNKTGYSNVSALWEVDKRRAKNAAKYFIDMQNIIKKSSKMLNKGGLALFVIGNTEYKQVRIDNAKHLAESMLLADYHEVRVIKRKISNKFLTPYRDKSGRFTTDKTCKKIYAEEFIVTGRKR